MKSVWDFPSRAAAIEKLGVEGFVAAVVREHQSRSGKHPPLFRRTRLENIPLHPTGTASLGSARVRVRNGPSSDELRSGALNHGFKQ